ncbi:MAG TPA: crotonase/enoyl-CoA hydratase family protein [Sphingobium sp.]|nr:crotonase/enoyl-CoA hydratase family protein [Sphingobium sp.]
MAKYEDIEGSLNLDNAASSRPLAPAAREAAAPRRLRFDLAEMDVSWESATGTLWSFMTPSGEPKYTPAMLRDLRRWQVETRRLVQEEALDLRYLVLGSRYPGAFNLGGDLAHVAGIIERRDRAALEAYGNACIEILYHNLQALSLPIITIALIQGDVVGGGLESALSFNVLVAERNARFSLPEQAFGMFPGVGAHALLTRRLGAAQAERLMFSGKIYSAEDMYALGLVHVLCEPGEGEAAVRAYVRQNERRRNGQLGAYRAARMIDPVTLEELQGIVRIWAETGMSLTDQQLRVMRRLAGKQVR